MLALYRSNHLERLAGDLARCMDQAAAGADPVFTPEQVAVENPAMAHWLSRRLADADGIHANVDFPLPATLMWRLLRCVLDDVPEQHVYAPDVLTWRVLDRLYAGDVPGGLKRYLDALPDTPRFELARRIARCFDQYVLYRPELTDGWQSGAGEGGWQALLWRRLAGKEPQHWASLVRRAIQRLSAGPDEAADLSALPPRVSFFAIGAMSPGYVELLKHLAGHMPIHLFILDPCRHYWGLIEPDRHIARRRRCGVTAADYRETGNDLLASMGKRMQVFNEIWEGIDEKSVSEDYRESDGSSLLHRVQRDIHHLRNGDGGGPVEPADTSVQIHACHSRRREVEVLYDRLLGLFATTPELSPADVLVMAPDIRNYEPFVRAVFGTAPELRRIPHSFAAAAGTDDAAARAYLELLGQQSAGYTAAAILSSLRVPGIRLAFGLEERAIDFLARKLDEAGICRHLDREDDGGSTPSYGTWRYVLDRLLLGFIGGARLRSFDGVFHSAALDGGSAASLGRLWYFIDSLREWSRRSAGRLLPADWAPHLRWSVNRFLDPGSAADSVRRLHDAVDALQKRADLAKVREPVPVGDVLSFLKQEAGSGGHVRLEGTHFCNLAHMHAVPYRVICLLGMSFDDYPDRDYADDFDLIAANPRHDDRSRRDEARSLFLEALLSARDSFYISYIGRSLYDNSEQPPSVLVSEWLDYLDRHYPHPDGNRVCRHPLQPFSRQYFTPASAPAPRLYSYAAEQCGIARALMQPAGPPVDAAIFWRPGHAAPAAAADGELALETLCRFFGNPMHYFLKQILHIDRPRKVSIPRSDEPFALQDFADSRLREMLYQALETDTDIRAIRERARADAVLPGGNIGRRLFDRQMALVQRLRSRLTERDLWPWPTAEVLTVDIPVELTADASGPAGAIRLTGRLRHIGGRYARVFPCGLRDGDVMKSWIEHLALCAAWPSAHGRVLTDGDIPRSEAYGIGTNRQDLRFPPMPGETAVTHLRDLIGLYRLGMARPLPLPPKSLVSAAVRGIDDKSSWLAKWREEWTRRAGDGLSPAQRYENALLFRGWRESQSYDDELAGRVVRLSQSLRSCLPPSSV